MPARSPLRTSLLAVLTAGLLLHPPAARAAPGGAPPPSRGDHRSVLERGLRGEVPLDRALAVASVRAGLEAAGLDEVAVEEDECVLEDGIAAPAGDLTGDGLADVIHYTFRIDFCGWTFHTTARGVVGADGTELWSLDLGDFGVLIPAGDLDGQPGVDLILYAPTFTSIPGSFRDTHVYEALNGATAGTLWSKTYENPWTVATAGPTAVYVDVNFALPGATTDADGDGVTDMMVHRYHIVAGTPDGSYADAFAAVLFESLSGADGSTVSTVSTVSHGSIPDAAVVPDLSGDGNPDLAVATAMPTEGGGLEGTLAAHAGTGGPALWEQDFAAKGYDYLLHGFELTGDAAGDVVVEAFDDEVTELHAFSGADGTPAWSTAESMWLYSLEAVPDVTGDGGQDLLVTGEPAYFAGDPGPAALLLGGGEGTTVWRRMVDYAEPAGDATGDGVADAVTWRWTGQRTITRLVSTATGANAWTHRDDEDGYAYLYPVRGDLDGDGATDVLRLGFGPKGENERALSGKDLRALWPSPLPVTGSLAWVEPGGVLEGSAGDILEHVFDEDDFSISVVARAGEDGRVLWSGPPTVAVG